jgi:hypothetical protein
MSSPHSHAFRVVLFCNKHGLSPSVKAGGYGTGGWAINGDVVIDLSRMHEMDIEPPQSDGGGYTSLRDTVQSTDKGKARVGQPILDLSAPATKKRVFDAEADDVTTSGIPASAWLNSTASAAVANFYTALRYRPTILARNLAAKRPTVGGSTLKAALLPFRTIPSPPGHSLRTLTQSPTVAVATPTLPLAPPKQMLALRRPRRPTPRHRRRRAPRNPTQPCTLRRLHRSHGLNPSTWLPHAPTRSRTSITSIPLCFPTLHRPRFRRLQLRGARMRPCWPTPCSQTISHLI